MSRGSTGFLEENLSVLSRRHPELVRLLRKEVSPPEGFVPMAGRRGFPTASVDGLLLHSAFDPVREAKSILGKEFPSEPSACVFLGFGLGYLPEEFITRFPDSDCLIVEPDLGIFKEALRQRPLGALGESARVSWVLGAGIEGSPGAMLDALEAISPRSLASIRLSGLAGRYEGFFRTAEVALTRFCGKSSINRNTLKRFGKLWVRNLARNLGELSRLPGIAGLEGLFEGFPALVIAAGPSLDAALPRIPALAERMLVVCVDTALNQVRRAHIDPDFVVVVDPQYWNTRHLDRTGTEKGFLLTESAAHPAVFKLPCAGKLLASSLFPLGSRLEEASGSKGKLGAGGSVATSAWDFARLLGASPIAIVGMDLGFPGASTHAKGSFFEERAILYGRRLAPAENGLFLSLHDAWPYQVPANDGGLVLTDKRMVLYSWWFESRMRRHPLTKTYNTSSEGVKIEGMPYAPLSAFLELPARRREIEKTMEGLLRLEKPNPEPVFLARDVLINELKEMESLSRQAITAAKAAREALAEGREAARECAALDIIEGAMRSSTAKEVVSFLLPSVEELVVEKVADLGQALEYSERIYTEACASASFHSHLLERSFLLSPSLTEKHKPFHGKNMDNG